MDIKIQPPRRDATLEELRAWCQRLTEEINLAFEAFEQKITKARDK